MDQARQAAKPDDPRVKAALAEYMERVDRDEQVDREQFLAAHADIADELGSFITTSEELARLASPARQESEAQSISTRSLAGRDQETLIPQRVKESPADSKAPGLPEQFGRYKILKPLGSGAMGTVYLAEDTQLHRKVAIKTPSFEQDETGELLERHRREARSAATLRHPHICPVFDIGEIGGKHFITMAYIEGRPLSAYIRPDKPQAERQTLVAVRKLALALQEAHDHNIIHRDLKPGNIMIDGKGEPIVMDFGLARKVHREDTSRLTQSGMIVGSPAYMSPEQVEGDPDKLGPAADQYSLGVILYELLTGQLPFRGSVTAVIGAILTKEPTPVTELRPGIDPRIAALCQRMMKKSASDRFPSMKAVAESIAGILKDAPSEAMKETVRTVESPAKPPATQGAKVKKTAEAAAAVSITASNVTSLFEAAQKCMRKHDYEQVVQILQQIPEQKRTDEVRALLTKARQLADEVAFLLAEIDEAERVNDNAVLTRATDELLKLKPKHHKALQIKEELSRYGKGKLWKPGGYTPDGRRIGEGSWIPWIGIAVGVIAFAITTWAVTIYLRSGSAVVRVQINDPNIKFTLQGQTITIDDNGKELRISPEDENTLSISYGDATFTSDQFTLNKGDNPAVVVEVLDQTLAAKFGELSIGEWPVEPQVDETTADDADLASMQGTWRVVAEEFNGAVVSEAELQAQDKTLTALNDHFNIERRFDDGTRSKTDGTIEIVQSTTPKQFNWSGTWLDGTSVELVGLYELKGDNLRMVYRMRKPGATNSRPTRFASIGEGGGTLVIDFERVPASTTSIVPVDAVAFQGHSYKYFGEKLTWKEARQRCEQMGGHLPIVETAAENGFLTQLAQRNIGAALTAKDSVWLGATDEDKEGDWRWINASMSPAWGTGAAYSNWAGNQPNNKQGVEHYATLKLPGDPSQTDGQWTDQPNVALANEQTVHFICEWDLIGAAATPSSQDGWTDLFNGRDLSGWDVMETANATVNDSSVHRRASGGWEVRNGVLVCTTNKPGWLKTQREYGDFVLQLEFKLPPKGNSGIYVRTPAQGHSSAVGMEVQVIDETRLNAGPNREWTGSIHRAAPAGASAMKPVGQWNSLEIECRGDDVSVTLNGTRLVQTNMQSNNALSGRPRRGYIGLANWMGEAAGTEFRNVRIRELSGGDGAQSAPAIAWTDLFNGRELTGWHTVGDAGWTVQNGVLTGAPGDGWIATDRDFTDFELQLDFRLSPRANSGVFLRIPDQGALSGGDFMEVQLIDETVQANVETWQRTGAIYAVQGPTPAPNPAVGQWHQLTIRADGPEITVSIDGAEVNRVHLDTAPVLGPPKRDLHRPGGHIGFQHRAQPVEFRNIRIRELSPATPAAAANAATTPRVAQPLPRNEWISLDPSAPRVTSWNWGKPMRNPENKKWENGVLSLDNAAVAFNQVQAKDVSFRAKVRFLEGNNMALVVRGEHGKGGVYALFDKQNNGQMLVAFLNTNKSKALALKDDYFDFQVDAIGDQVSIQVNGQTVVRHRETQKLKAGHIEVTAYNARGMFKEMAVKILDEAPAAASGAAAQDGWSNLFNGTGLTGWQPMETLGGGGDQHRPTTGGWEARNGELTCTTDQPGWLKSAAQYGDFEFETEFKVPVGGNSDIYIRCPGSGRLSRSGMAIQIIDEHSGKFTMDPTNRPGAIWGVVGHDIAPVTRPLGEWNSLSIRCEGDRVQVSINGQQTVDANMQAVAELRDRPRSGFIGIANWGGEAKGVAFRNMRIRELSSGKEDTASLQGKWTAIGQEIAGGVWTQEQIAEHDSGTAS